MDLLEVVVEEHWLDIDVVDTPAVRVTSARRRHTDSIRATGANELSKSTPSYCINPCATNCALCLKMAPAYPSSACTPTWEWSCENWVEDQLAPKSGSYQQVPSPASLWRSMLCVPPTRLRSKAHHRCTWGGPPPSGRAIPTPTPFGHQECLSWYGTGEACCHGMHDVVLVVGEQTNELHLAVLILSRCCWSAWRSSCWLSRVWSSHWWWCCSMRRIRCTHQSWCNRTHNSRCTHQRRWNRASSNRCTRRS